MMASFLSIPLEIRLKVYFYASQLKPNCCQQDVYNCFTLFNTGHGAPKLCRASFRSIWSARRDYAHWPVDDMRRMSLICKQVNLELREAYHPGPLSLTIIEDTYFSLCSTDKLYTAITERPWLLSLEIIRLDLTGWNAYPEFFPVLEPWLKTNVPLSDLRLDVQKEKTKWPALLSEWKSRITGRQKRAVATPEVNQNQPSHQKQYNFESFIEQLKAFPRLRLVEIVIRSDEAFENWADPISTLKAIYALPMKLFSVISQPYSDKCSARNLIDGSPEYGYLIFKSPDKWPKPLVAASHAQNDEAWHVHIQPPFFDAYKISRTSDDPALNRLSRIR